jgi:hypothetical protein
MLAFFHNAGCIECIEEEDELFRMPRSFPLLLPDAVDEIAAGERVRERTDW